VSVFERIVIAYDDSPGARQALDTAVALAKQGGGELTAVAVEAHLPHYGATVGEVEEERAVEEQACQRWLKSATAYAAERGIELRTEIRAGHPAQELIRAADARHADILVIGHSGHSAVWGRLVGTTAERVGRHAHCSVLIVR
jgi:nucleotide-binding universal stress UspA family protein